MKSHHTVEEIETMIQQIKNYKFEGENGTAAENLKYGGIGL